MSDDALATASGALQEAYTNAAAQQGDGDKIVGHVLWTPEMVQYLTVALLVFTFLVLVMVTILLYKKDQWGLQTLRTFGIILIISLSSVLLIVGYSNEQLTPIVGLFGAIAGYLLGRTNSPPAPVAAGGGAASSPASLPASPAGMPANPDA